jgi:hypothetical protein
MEDSESRWQVFIPLRGCYQRFASTTQVVDVVCGRFNRPQHKKRRTNEYPPGKTLRRLPCEYDVQMDDSYMMEASKALSTGIPCVYDMLRDVVKVVDGGTTPPRPKAT